jgi:hypothetical protein
LRKLEKSHQRRKHSINKNETWEYVDRDQAKGKNILTSRWIFKEKDNRRFKARLVVRGCRHRGAGKQQVAVFLGQKMEKRAEIVKCVYY